MLKYIYIVKIMILFENLISKIYLSYKKSVFLAYCIYICRINETSYQVEFLQNI